jgi:hypothetical protein
MIILGLSWLFTGKKAAYICVVIESKGSEKEKSITTEQDLVRIFIWQAIVRGPLFLQKTLFFM